MASFVRGSLRYEAGFTLVELVVGCVIIVALMAGLSNMLVSAQRASTDANARMQSQQYVRSAFQRLEYDTRCAQTAKILSSGAGVHLTFPTTWTCAHASGDVTWCVSSGSLKRISGTSCTGGSIFMNNVTSATPFACYTPSGVTSPLPQLRVILTVNSTTRTTNATTATDYITMHNGSGGCS